MGINIKYYVISITAIFLSLGIGIFIGFNMNGQDLYLEQQQALIDSLEIRFDEFKTENKDLEQKVENLSAQNEKQSIFIENTLKEIVYNKLQGLNVAIVETTDDYFYTDVRDVLESSGANVPIRIQYTDKIFTATKEKVAEISELLQVQLKTTDDFIYFVNNEITNLLLNKEITEAVNFLIDEEYVVCNINYNNIEELNIENIVMAGGSNENLENKMEKIDVALAKKLSNIGFRVIGVERLDVEQSFISDFKKINISTVDNIDSRIGQTSLVYIIKGAEGHYGEKSTADSLIPFDSIEQVRSEDIE